MTKEEKIKEAYGIHYEEVKNKIDENGWLFDSLDFFNNEMPNIDIDHKWSEAIEESWYRPESLSGIENNNGWIKIESKDDLPKEEKDYWVVDSYGEVFICYFDEDYKAFKGYFHYDENGKITHYQQIVKPKPPLY